MISGGLRKRNATFVSTLVRNFSSLSSTSAGAMASRRKCDGGTEYPRWRGDKRECDEGKDHGIVVECAATALHGARPVPRGPLVCGSAERIQRFATGRRERLGGGCRDKHGGPPSADHEVAVLGGVWRRGRECDLGRSPRVSSIVQRHGIQGVEVDAAR